MRLRRCGLNLHGPWSYDVFFFSKSYIARKRKNAVDATVDEYARMTRYRDRISKRLELLDWITERDHPRICSDFAWINLGQAQPTIERRLRITHVFCDENFISMFASDKTEYSWYLPALSLGHPTDLCILLASACDHLDSIFSSSFEAPIYVIGFRRRNRDIS